MIDDLTPEQKADIERRTALLNASQAYLTGEMRKTSPGEMLLTGGHAQRDLSGLNREYDNLRAQALRPYAELQERRRAEADAENLRGSRLKNDAEAIQLQQTRDALDPNSDLSQRSQKEYGNLLALRSKVIRPSLPQIADALDHYDVNGKSHSQLTQHNQQLSQLLGEGLKIADAQIAAQQKRATVDNLTEDNKRADAQFEETKRHNRATENLAGEKADRAADRAAKKADDIKLSVNQEKEITDLGKLLGYMSSSGEWVNGLQSGKIKTGYGEGTRNELARNNIVQGLEALTGYHPKALEPSQEYGEMAAQKDPLYAEMERILSGSSRWNAAQQERFKNSLLYPEKQQPDEMLRRLGGMRGMVQDEIDNKILDLLTDKAGNPVPVDVISRRTGIAPEKIQEMVARAQKKNTRSMAPETHLSQQMPAPGAKQLSPQDKKALDWANANPNDPRAAAIKKKLGVQ